MKLVLVAHNRSMSSDAKLLICKSQVLLREKRALENLKGRFFKKLAIESLGDEENRERTRLLCLLSGLAGGGHLIRRERQGVG